MAKYDVIHQRFADGFTVHSVVEAASEQEAQAKVWPKFNDEWCWLTTVLIAPEEEHEWDIPFAWDGTSLA